MDRYTALFIACQFPRKHAVVQLLLDHGARVNHTTTQGNTALQMVCVEGSLEIAKLLLDRGADPNLHRTGNTATPLSFAAQFGHFDIVRLLLEKGAEPNHRLYDSTVPLFHACQKGHPSVAQLLLNSGADANVAQAETGTTALHVACEQGNACIVRLLLDNGADPNLARTDNGETPLMFGCLKPHVGVVRLLMSHGANINQATTDLGQTALRATALTGNCDLARFLLDAGADPNMARTDNGETIIVGAAQKNFTNMVQLLAVFGASLGTGMSFGGQTLTAQLVAEAAGHEALDAWLTMAAHWGPLQVAAACRLHNAAASALRLGCIDPFLVGKSRGGKGRSCTVARAHLIKVATLTDLWPDMPPVCKATQRLVRAATALWSPERHWLYHWEFRAAVSTVLLVRQRLVDNHHTAVARFAAVNAGEHGGKSLDSMQWTADPVLPMEMWLLVCTFLLRGHWVRPVSSFK